jgi:homopolymeric O-antigen transport system permease protein
VLDTHSDAQSAAPQTQFQSALGAAPDALLTIIRPVRGWRALGLRDLWPYRELFYFLTVRDLKVRYRQSVIGAGWGVLKPFVQMVVFTVFFGKLAGLSSDGAPYAVFSFAALIPWNLFSSALNQASVSLTMNQTLITKVYFPRLIIPIASTLSNVVDFVISCLVMAGLMVYYHVTPTIWIAVLPLLFLLTMATALGAGLWLAALNARYRDIQYVSGFLVQLWFFLTPVVYSAGILPARFTFIYGLNPMVGVVQGFRSALIGSATHGHVAQVAALHVGPLLILSCGIVLVMLVGGLAYFRRTETIFADVV